MIYSFHKIRKINAIKQKKIRKKRMKKRKQNFTKQGVERWKN